MTTQLMAGAWGVPGIRETLETAVNNVCWGKEEQQVTQNGLISGAARDAGNTPTTLIRPGLLMTLDVATSKFVEWATGLPLDAVFLGDFQTQSRGGNADGFVGWFLRGGNVKTANLLIPGAANPGIVGATLEFEIRNALAQIGMRVDDYPYLGGSLNYVRALVAKTADYTVLERDNHVHFTNAGAAGAVVFTLPATAKKGLHYKFSVVVDQNVTITAGTADTIIAFNDVAADSLAFSTSSAKIGGCIEVVGDGAKWIATTQNAGANTITIAT